MTAEPSPDTGEHVDQEGHGAWDPIPADEAEALGTLNHMEASVVRAYRKSREAHGEEFVPLATIVPVPGSLFYADGGHLRGVISQVVSDQAKTGLEVVMGRMAMSMSQVTREAALEGADALRRLGERLEQRHREAVQAALLPYLDPSDMGQA